MTTITIMHTKGGVGKTTSAMYLATAASRAGIKSVVVDSDSQGSAGAWAKIASKRTRKLPFEVVETGSNISPLIKDLAGPDGLVFIDTPPGTSPAISESVKLADLVVVPCGASPIELQRVWPTLSFLNGHPALVLLTNVDLRSNLSAQIRKRLLETEVPVLRSLVPQRSQIKRSFGKTPDALYGYDDVLKELVGALV